MQNLSFKSLDLFATPISLTYKRDWRYRSTCGGLVTLLSVVVILSYVCMSGIEVSQNKVNSFTNEPSKLDLDSA